MCPGIKKEIKFLHKADIMGVLGYTYSWHFKSNCAKLSAIIVEPRSSKSTIYIQLYVCGHITFDFTLNSINHNF